MSRQLNPQVEFRQLAYPYREPRHTASFGGLFTLEIIGTDTLELLADYFRNQFSEQLEAFLRQQIENNPRIYDAGRIPTDRIRAYFLERLNEQQQRINQLPLAPKTIAQLKNQRRTFRVENTFNVLRELVNRDIYRERNRIFNIRISNTRDGRKRLTISLNTMYLLRLLASQQFMVSINLGEDDDMTPERRKKKVYGLFLNILLGYRTFVTQVMRARADLRHDRPGLPYGYFPPIQPLELDIPAGQDLLQHIKRRHRNITDAAVQQILAEIDSIIGQ